MKKYLSLVGLTYFWEKIKAYVEKVVSSAVEEAKKSFSGGLVYKGTKATYEELPTEGNAVGDMWNVEQAHGNTPAGTNYAWTGTEWDPLGGDIDLSGMLTDKDLEEISNNEIDSLFNE